MLTMPFHYVESTVSQFTKQILYSNATFSLDRVLSYENGGEDSAVVVITPNQKFRKGRSICKKYR